MFQLAKSISRSGPCISGIAAISGRYALDMGAKPRKAACSVPDVLAKVPLQIRNSLQPANAPHATTTFAVWLRPPRCTIPPSPKFPLRFDGSQLQITSRVARSQHNFTSVFGAFVLRVGFGGQYVISARISRQMLGQFSRHPFSRVELRQRQKMTEQCPDTAGETRALGAKLQVASCKLHDS